MWIFRVHLCVHAHLCSREHRIIRISTLPITTTTNNNNNVSMCIDMSMRIRTSISFAPADAELDDVIVFSLSTHSSTRNLVHVVRPHHVASPITWYHRHHEHALSGASYAMSHVQ